MPFNTEPVYTYYLIRWPDDRRGLSLGIVKSISCKRVFRELYRIYGRRNSYLKVKSCGIIYTHCVLLYKGTYEECLENFSTFGIWSKLSSIHEPELPY